MILAVDRSIDRVNIASNDRLTTNRHATFASGLDGQFLRAALAALGQRQRELMRDAVNAVIDLNISPTAIGAASDDQFNLVAHIIHGWSH